MISAFGDVLSEIHRAHATYATRNLNFVMSANDDMINRNNPVWFEQYIQVGKSAIENIFSAMIACSKPTLHSVLDMPRDCGGDNTRKTFSLHSA